MLVFYSRLNLILVWMIRLNLLEDIVDLDVKWLSIFFQDCRMVSSISRWFVHENTYSFYFTSNRSAPLYLQLSKEAKEGSKKCVNIIKELFAKEEYY